MKLICFISWLPIVLATSTSTITKTGIKSPSSYNATSHYKAVKSTNITSQISIVPGSTTYNSIQTARSDSEIPRYNTTINHSHATTNSSMNISQLTPSYHIRVTSISTNHTTKVSSGTNATTETVSFALSTVITGNGSSEYTVIYSSNPGQKSSTIAKTSSNEKTSLSSDILISDTSTTKETVRSAMSSVSTGITTSENETNFSISSDLKSSIIKSANLSTHIIKSSSAPETTIKTTLGSNTNTKSSSYITTSVATMVSEMGKVQSNIWKTSSIKTTSSTGDAGSKSTYIRSSSSINSTFGILSISSYTTALKLNTSTWIQFVSFTTSQISVYNEYTSNISHTTMTSENSGERSVRSSTDPVITSKLYSSTKTTLTINHTIAIRNTTTSMKNTHSSNVSVSKAQSYVSESSSTADIPTISIKNSHEVLETSSNGGVEISRTTASTERETMTDPAKKHTSMTETMKKTRSEIKHTASATAATPMEYSAMLLPSRTSQVKFQNLSTVSRSSITHSVKGKGTSLFLSMYFWDVIKYLINMNFEKH